MKKLRQLITLRTLMIFFFALGFTAYALAQNEPGPAPPDGALGQVVVWLLSASGIAVVAQMLLNTNVAANVPPWLKPFIGPIFGVLAGLASQYWGIVADFGPITGALLGTTAANAFDAAKGFGWLKSTG